MSSPASAAPRASRTPWVVLGLLAFEPMSGYDLKSTIENTVGHFWQESYGQLYPTLRSLRAEGLVTMTSEPDGARVRHVYAITDPGRAALMAWLEEPPRATPVRNELLLKVFFASLADAAALRRHLRHALERVDEQRAVLAAIREAIAREPADAHQRRCWTLTVDLGLRNAEAVEAWATQALAELDAEADAGGEARP